MKEDKQNEHIEIIKIPTEQKMVTDKMGMQNTSQRKE